MSSGAKIQTKIVEETTPGETPSPAEWDFLRLTSNTLSPNVGTETSSEIRDSRMGSGSIITSLDYSGELGFEFSALTFDKLLAAAFFGDWDEGGVLAIGDTRHTFSVQKAYKDVNVYHLFRGLHVGSMSLDIPEEGIVTGSFALAGLGYEDATTDFTTGVDDTTNPATGTIAMGSANSVGTITIDGTSLEGTACISALSMEINNNLQVQRCLGQAGPGAQIETQAAITGSITLAWSAASYQIWKKMFTRAFIDIVFPLTDGTNTYEFRIPKAEVDGELPDAGNEDIVQVQLNYIAKVDPVTVTRTPA